MYQLRTFFSLVGLLVSIGMSGCTNQKLHLSDIEKTQAYEAYVSKNEIPELKRITAFRFHGWRYLNKEYLIISTRINKPYLIKVSQPCNDLQFSHAIGIRNSGSTLQTRFDSIKPLHNNGFECFIKSIYQLTPDQADELALIGTNEPSPERLATESEENNTEY